MELKERCTLTLTFLTRFLEILNDPTQIDSCVIGRQSVKIKDQPVGISTVALPDSLDSYQNIPGSDLWIDRDRVPGESNHYTSKIPGPSNMAFLAKDQIVLDALTGVVGSEVYELKQADLDAAMSSPDLAKCAQLSSSLTNLCYYALYPVMQELSDFQFQTEELSDFQTDKKVVYVTNFIERLKEGIASEIKNQQKLLGYFNCMPKNLMKSAAASGSALFCIVYFSLWQAGVGFEPFAAQASPASVLCLLLVLLAIMANAMILKCVYDNHRELGQLLERSQKIEKLVLSESITPVVRSVPETPRKKTRCRSKSIQEVAATPEKSEDDDCHNGLERDGLERENSAVSETPVFSPYF